ncbi:MAG: 1-deoxy-D-xylulose-5-phosphate reductoisomerase [Acidimicrobiia bacterium]
MSTPSKVAILGSTGSIGTQTLDVINSAPNDYEVVALSAHSSAEALVAQAQRYKPALVVVSDEEVASRVRGQLPSQTEIMLGTEGFAEAARLCDVVVNGVVGFAGLAATIETLRAGKRLALANKESLIAGGPVVRAVAQTPGAEIVPVDSEHAAVHQCLRSSDRSEALRRIVLTASGGPFRGFSAEQLAAVSVEEALAHPTWSMGPKITIDSSTMMNKGLEVIEAHELFDASYDQIEVVIHPQSIVHSMVEWSDGSTIAQISEPTMCLPIAYALAYPDRHDTAFGAMDWRNPTTLEFFPPDLTAFPALGLAYEAGRAGGSMPAWLNGANEIAVAAFLGGSIRWIDIVEVCKRAMARHDGGEADSLEAVVHADRQARHAAHSAVQELS